MKNNLTTGSVWKTVLYFSIPYLLSYFLQTLYGMADLFIIGQFCGVEGTTAVSIGSQFMHMVTVMIVGLAMGSTVMIGRAIGARKQKQVSNTIGNTITLFMVLSVFLTVSLLFFVKPLVGILSTPKQAVSGTISYLTICFIGIPFITAYNIICSIFRGMGDSKSPMYFIALACAVNIGLDYLLIGGMGLGASGAALGTTLAQTVSVAAAVFVIVKRKMGVSLKTEDFKLRRRTMAALLKIGIPVALQDGFIQIAFIAITVFANQRGLNDAAAVGIVEKIISILFLVPSTMLQTVSALSAQNLGAGKHDRALRTMCYASVIAVVWGTAAVIFVQLNANILIRMFSESQQVAVLGSQYIRGYVWDCILAGIHFCFSGYFCAYGLAGISFLHNSLSIICVRIPLSYLAAHYCMGSLFPMGLASPAGSALSVIICIAVFAWMVKKAKGERT